MAGDSAVELSNTLRIASKSAGLVSSLDCNMIKRLLLLSSSLGPSVPIWRTITAGMSSLAKSSSAKRAGLCTASTS